MPFCRFCFDNKIDGPHNHYLRETKDPSSRVTCPLLLNTRCLKCNQKGHTANYCKMTTKNFQVKASKEYDVDGFMIIKGRNQKTNKEVKENIENVNKFAILCQDINSEVPVINKAIIKPFAVRPTGMSWADWEEMDD